MGIISPAPRAMAAAVLRVFRSIAGSTAAGVGILFLGHAGFAVAGAAGNVLVYLATCACVQGRFIRLGVGYWYRWF
jgi:hypothetical protein